MSMSLEQAQFTINNLLRRHAATSGIPMSTLGQESGSAATMPSQYREYMAQQRLRSIQDAAMNAGTSHADMLQQQQDAQSQIARPTAPVMPASIIPGQGAMLPSNFRESPTYPGSYEMLNQQTGMWDPFQGTLQDIMAQQQNPAAPPAAPTVVPGAAAAPPPNPIARPAAPVGPPSVIPAAAPPTAVPLVNTAKPTQPLMPNPATTNTLGRPATPTLGLPNTVPGSTTPTVAPQTYQYDQPLNYTLSAATQAYMSPFGTGPNAHNVDSAGRPIDWSGYQANPWTAAATPVTLPPAPSSGNSTPFQPRQPTGPAPADGSFWQ